MKNRDLKSAWIITWEWIGDHAAKEEKIVSILNYRKSAEYVKEYMEQLYLDISYGVVDKVNIAKNRKKFLGDPARFLSVCGVVFTGRIFCGGNPHLYGRKVKNVRIIDNLLSENETIEWEEIEIPNEVFELQKMLLSHHNS